MDYRQYPQVIEPQRFQRGTIAAAIDGLSRKEKAVFLCRFYGEMSWREIGNTIHMTAPCCLRMYRKVLGKITTSIKQTKSNTPHLSEERNTENEIEEYINSRSRIY